MARLRKTTDLPRLSVLTCCGALLVGMAGCAGEAIEPGRSANHPANPATTEAPFVAPPSSLGGGDAPTTGARPAGPASSGVPAMPGDPMYGMHMPGMPGMEMHGGANAKDGGAKDEPGKSK